MQHDVIIIGGSYAGMAAGLQLLRARRTVLVIDAGLRRNRFTSHSHGFLGQDGVDPAEIARVAREQLTAYPTLTWIEGEAVKITGDRDSFVVGTASGPSHQGARILLATGVTDALPEIDGLAERWGRSVFHCPYCHGYEMEQGQIGVIGTSLMSTHQAELLAEWGDVTFLTNSALTLDATTRKTFAAKGILIEETPIRRIDGIADVHMADGRCLTFAGLFTATRTAPTGSLAWNSGCVVEETPMGHSIQRGPTNQTTVPGIFACGDVASMPHSVSLAVGDGAMTGMQVHRSLIWPEAI